MKEKLAKKVFKSWYGILNPILTSKYFGILIKQLENLYKTEKIWPEQKKVFRTFQLTNYRDLKVVIIGQDPYPNSRANGLAFANSNNTGSLSPSLRKIREVIEDDYYQGLNLNFDQTLESWAKQGVLLINTALTVEEGNAGSHAVKWEKFTQGVLEQLSLYNPGTIYVLWGGYAKGFKKYINQESNHIIEAEHPAASLYGGGRKWNFSFKKIDEITTKLYGDKIKW